ncbi:integrase family protein [Yersinia enterocolitica]|uniref:Integrase family protein n=1 Tax=Yersinia enterocolitica TaxID=630 RepID=A0ABP1XXN7_YEREN|nr:integrase family protein [Yersinia enterocolitica]CNE14889.1 integrase family protein [Yersinia enterocolitica]CNG50247.1 integrase family protein [Yersinia enterocolitica]CQD73251.1 integrase family protein [Yersinia enterocolitica]CRX94716.1 integrase family protein [Yersinia enterocolitica]
MWTIPAEREAIEGVKHSQRGSKMRTPHLVPLSRQALNILEKIKTFSGDHELIFIGDHNPRKPMSENTVNKSLRVMGYDTQVEVCGHGFRTMACSSLIESGLWSRDAVECSGQQKLATALEFFQNNRSDSFGVKPPLY